MSQNNQSYKNLEIFKLFKELKERLDSKKLRAKKKGHTSSYSDDFENVSFEEYINRQFDFDDMIKKDLDKFMDDIRKQVNKTMKETIDNSTKSILEKNGFNNVVNGGTWNNVQKVITEN